MTMTRKIKVDRNGAVLNAEVLDVGDIIEIEMPAEVTGIVTSVVEMPHGTPCALRDIEIQTRDMLVSLRRNDKVRVTKIE